MTADDHRLAADLAEAAGEQLLALRSAQGFADAALLRERGDRTSHEYLAARLARERPDDAVRSEEARDAEPGRDAADRVWIVDPLDGTREYAEEGRDDWAVHVALWERGVLSAGAVAIPARGAVLTTAFPPKVPSVWPGPPRIAVSRSRPPEFVTRLGAALNAQLVPMGSAGVKIASVVQGLTDVYVHAGGQYEWDSAAPVAVALAAGLHCSRVDGSPLRYNQPDPWLPDLLVCRPQDAEQLLAAIAETR
ncbi:3'(2'),5'-bisphosphate nucleotidase CysQ [Streptacidiphilus jiangxiensis]|uniref:3'(2'), 5'-bisphosphate nucleotidase n=1 Tax=Streptacidiphilus jiangxiensis TaxID=235985 RepID=A0A1H7ZN13_STRJI|nr:3'(2'),5'-bisphosphate nucleotidase CysQ [Streptacidiphilus jiangxiensis]SEM58879.1 3'(2'), 5'-bisphosphate nucleotidase [Streptacidiphilus jiangxiensis]